MPKGTRGGKKAFAPGIKRSEFVWKLAEQGITNANKQAEIQKFIKKYPKEDYADLLGDVDSAATEITIAKRRNVPIYYYGDKVPDGYTPIQGATTAPKGFEWYSNNKSRWSGERKSVLVAIPDYWRLPG